MGKVGRFVTDPKAGAYCQVTLDSGDKLIVNHARGGFKGGPLTIETTKWWGGGQRIVNIDLDSAVAKNQTVIAAYATRRDRPDFPFWPMLFDNITIRLLGSDDFPAAAKQRAAADLTAAARDGALAIAIGAPLPLERIAEAHDRVDAGTRDRILLAIPD